MATIFPREEKAEALFGEILKNPEACHRLMDTFNDSLYIVILNSFQKPVNSTFSHQKND